MTEVSGEFLTVLEMSDEDESLRIAFVGTNELENLSMVREPTSFGPENLVKLVCGTEHFTEDLGALASAVGRRRQDHDLVSVDLGPELLGQQSHLLSATIVETVVGSVWTMTSDYQLIHLPFFSFFVLSGEISPGTYPKVILHRKECFVNVLNLERFLIKTISLV